MNVKDGRIGALVNDCLLLIKKNNTNAYLLGKHLNDLETEIDGRNYFLTWVEQNLGMNRVDTLKFIRVFKKFNGQDSRIAHLHPNMLFRIACH